MFGWQPINLQLTPAHKEFLAKLRIEPLFPGPLLHDMGAILDILKTEGGIELSKTHRLTLKWLTPINERLHEPVCQDLKRPQPKSYPPLLGLYLLLRASGLTMVDETGKKPMLRLDEDVYQQWQTMNPTEQYGELLAAWLLRGHEDIIGEWRRKFDPIPTNFYYSTMFYSKLPGEGLKVAGDRNAEEELKYYPSMHNLGLLYEFGLIRIVSAPPEPGKGWRIERIYPTPTGDALLALLLTELFGDLDKIFKLEDESESGQITTSVIQDLLKPYFTDWQKRLQIAATEFQPGTYTFKVTLGKVWRRIEIDADFSLDELAATILSAVNFDNDHLYEFTYRNRFGSMENIVHPYMEDAPIASEVQIGRLVLPVGGHMTFHYDFGDDWKFDVLLEKFEPERSIQSARVIESKGTAPQQYRSW